MSSKEIGPMARTLIDAKKLIEDPTKWRRGMYEAGGRMCAVGALMTAAHTPQFLSYYLDKTLFDTLSGAAHELYGTNILSVNDHIGHAAVMAVYDHAIAKAIGAGK